MRRTDGFALPLTLAIMSITLILIFATSIAMINDRANSANDRSATQAEEVAKAGFTKYKTAAFQTFRYYVENAEKYATPAARSAQCGNLLSIGLDLGRDGLGNGMTGGAGDANDLMNGQSRTGTVAVGNATGTYTVKYTVSGSGIILRSEGKVNGAKAVVQAFLAGQNSSGFSNAIFAGASGQSGRNLNGSADIYGSVYVEGSPGTNLALNANGGFSIHNFYSKSQLSSLTGLTNDKLASFLKLQALEQTDMCASVRARNGGISFDANSTIGDAVTQEQAAAGFKGTMKGVYAGQPSSTGTYDRSQYIIGKDTQATNIKAESFGPFDLVPPPALPKLDQTGLVNLSKLSPNVQAAVGTNPTWRASIQKEAELNGLVIKKSGSSAVSEPSNVNCNIASAVANGQLSFGEQTMNCKDSAGRGFTYTKDAASNTWLLDINGTLDIRGLNVQFNQNVIVRYEGKASMLVEKDGSGAGGNVTINGDVLPYDSFPDKSVLGLMAENNLTISGMNQQQLGSYTRTQVVTGLFYAGNTVAAVKDSVVMGTLMGDGFDLSNGSNGGSAKTQILQVPGLEYNLPPGFASLNNTSVPSFAVYSFERK